MRYYPAFDVKSGLDTCFRRFLAPNPWIPDFSAYLSLFLTMIPYLREAALAPG
jgi:hypothetical protein